jgi:hypothetical protein
MPDHVRGRVAQINYVTGKRMDFALFAHFPSHSMLDDVN